MRSVWNSLLPLTLWVGVVHGAISVCKTGVEGDVYGFNLTEIDEATPLPLEQYRGKVLVVFNSATY